MRRGRIVITPSQTARKFRQRIYRIERIFNNLLNPFNPLMNGFAIPESPPPRHLRPSCKVAGHLRG